LRVDKVAAIVITSGSHFFALNLSVAPMAPHTRTEVSLNALALRLALRVLLVVPVGLLLLLREQPVRGLSLNA
jgi:hypothetical protein